MTEDDVRRIVFSLKDCLRESHIACEKCPPGFDERNRRIMEQQMAEWRKQSKRIRVKLFDSPPW